MNKNKVSRRGFIKFTAIASATVPFTTSTLMASDLPKLEESDPTAIGLGYKHDTADVDSEKYPNHTVEQKCINCVLYQGDDPQWGGCGAFPGKLVAGEGWCVAYAAKPDAGT